MHCMILQLARAHHLRKHQQRLWLLIKLTAAACGLCQPKPPYTLSPHWTAPCTCRDEDRGFQLYHSDPSGNYGGWKATAIGQNHQAAQNILKQDYKEEINLEEAMQLVIKVKMPVA